MNNTSHLRPSNVCPELRPGGAARKSLSLAVPALLFLGATGCYRATGLQRSTVVAEAIPVTGGDRVVGLKSMAGPGDYYLGNDFIQVAVDGSTFGDTTRPPIAGAASGGSIVDAGYLRLDTSYQRVSMPGDSLERLTPVVNQDPAIQVIVDSFLPDSSVEPSSLTMNGRIYDPEHKVSGATWDAAGIIQGVKVVHKLTLAKLDRFFKITTTVVNESGSPLGIRSVGDFLSQESAGFRFNVPAGVTITGEPLAQPWGVQIPGCDFGNPIATSVQSPMVAFMATEPGAGTLDSHASLGIMSEDAPVVMVTSDPQDAFEATRPVFPHRIVVGGLPLPPTGLAAGASMTYVRRLYISGGTSTASNAPNEAAYLFTSMAIAKYNSTNGLWPQDFGQLSFGLVGSATRQGPLATEVRMERNAGGSLANPVWIPEQVGWLESTENISSQSSLGTSSMGAYLPVGTYRLVITNKLGTQIKIAAANSSSGLRPLLSGPIDILPGTYFSVGGTDYLCPEADSVLSETGTMFRSLYTVHYFDTRERNAPAGSLQPMRIVMKGLDGVPDPFMRRSRTLGTYFEPITKKVALTSSSAPGQIQFRAGNEMFGTGFSSYPQTRYFWFPNGTVTGSSGTEGSPVVSGGRYRAYATRGPLSNLESLDLTAYDGQYNNTHSFIVWPKSLPTGWVAFDMPGPSQATTGGLLPAEKLASAMAEGVNVVAHTEKDLGVDASAVYNDFKAEFNGAGFLATQLTAIGNDPYVIGARSSDLAGFGTATSLFTPTATSNRFGGVLQNSNWSLADFITQARGEYVVVHRPRGPQGLFNAAGFDPAAALGSGANAWWTGTGAYSQGVTNGSFDAIELLRGEGFDGASPDAWFQEFKQVRSDWFALLNMETPTHFTKALGLSSSRYSIDTPVGLARTFLKATPTITNPPLLNTTSTDPLIQDLTTVLAALRSGAAVASTGPFLDVSVGTKGPGSLVAGPAASVNLTINLYRSDWMPVDQLRIVVNGAVVATIDPATLAQDTTDTRLWSGTFPVVMPTTGTGAWIVVEAGVPLTQTGPYAVGTPWHDIMRGIYPIAVTNPIFVDVTGSGYTHP